MGLYGQREDPRTDLMGGQTLGRSFSSLVHEKFVSIAQCLAMVLSDRTSHVDPPP